MHTPATQDVLLARQPILDRQQKLFAYELLFRGTRANHATVIDNLAATATVINSAFSDLGVDAVLGPHKGFVNVDEALLDSELVELLPSDKIVLELLETVVITPAVVARCAELKAQGFLLALDDFVSMQENFQPLLPHIDVVKVDMQLTPTDQLHTLVARLRQWPLKLLAEKVDNFETAALCHELGFDYFQGYYFARPRMMEGKKLNPSETALLRLMGLVSQDAESSQIEDVLKAEPALMLNLIRLTNSVSNGLRCQITSLRQAITVLGRRQLQRWVQLLLYTNAAGAGAMPSPLMLMAATRARFMELMRARLAASDSEAEDRAFMTGILSLMPAVLGIPMEQIIGPLNLGDKVRDALLNRDGKLGLLLQMIERLEENDAPGAMALIGQLPEVNTQEVVDAVTRAMAWSATIGQEAAG